MIITKYDSVSIDPDLYCSDRVVIERQKKNTYIKVDNRKQKEEMEKALFILVLLCRETDSEIKITKKELLQISERTKSVPMKIKLKEFLGKKYPSLLDIVKSIETKEYVKKENLIFDYIEDFPTKVNVHFRSEALHTVPFMAIYNKKRENIYKITDKYIGRLYKRNFVSSWKRYSLGIGR